MNKSIFVIFLALASASLQEDLVAIEETVYGESLLTMIEENLSGENPLHTIQTELDRLWMDLKD